MTDTLRRRLLNLFPVKNLAEMIDGQKTSKDTIITSILSRTNSGETIAWVNKNFEIARHHVYFFSSSKHINCVPNKFSLLGTKPSALDARECLFLLDLTYQVVIRTSENTFKEIPIVFKWPVKIEFLGKVILVKMIIMEKKIDAYLDDSERRINDTRDLEEADILTGAQKALHGVCTVDPLDLNKGIKTLWDADMIDSREVKYKKSVSTTTETMDDKRYVKRDLAAQYKELIKVPLLKTIFDAMDETKRLSDHFRADSTAGVVTFPVFSENPQQPKNVVREILKNN